jgi:hypothetical protein
VGDYTNIRQSMVHVKTNISYRQTVIISCKNRVHASETQSSYNHMPLTSEPEELGSN